ncbi:MAG: hypothetical protein AVDCRST_MAG96-3323, partial [uncultured Segetibacter sp.]
DNRKARFSFEQIKVKCAKCGSTYFFKHYCRAFVCTNYFI